MSGQRYSRLSLSALQVCCWYLLLLMYAPLAVGNTSVRLQQVMLAEDASAKKPACMGGWVGDSIKLQSQLGQGTTAILTLPQQRWTHEQEI